MSPGLGAGYSPQQKEPCAICKVPTETRNLAQCDWCEQNLVCPCCFLAVEGAPGERACYSCALPACGTCGWRGENIQTLEYCFPTGRKDLPLHICPSCKQGGEVHAMRGERRIPAGFYGKNPLRISERAKADILEALTRVGW